MSIFEGICTEIDEIRALLRTACTNGDHNEITAAVDLRLDQVLTLATEQNLLLNARLNITQTPSMSYADALRKTTINSTSTAKQQTPNTADTLLLYPSSSQNSSLQTFNELKKKIDIESLSINVKKVKFIRNGGVAISVMDKTSLKTLRQAVNELPEFNAKKPTMANPYVKVLDVPNEITDENIVDAIISATEEVSINDHKTAYIKKIYETKDKRNDSRSIVLQLHPKQWNILIETGYLKISWYRMKIVNSIPIKRCYRCQAFGHIAKNCESKNATCSHCADCHDNKHCTKTRETPTCTNCIHHNSEFKTTYPTNHSAYSQQCNVYKSFRSKIEKSIKYIHV